MIGTRERVGALILLCACSEAAKPEGSAGGTGGASGGAGEAGESAKGRGGAAVGSTGAGGSADLTPDAGASGGAASSGVRYLLDDFESPNRVVQPGSTDPGTRFLWSLYLGADTGSTALSTEHHDGRQSMAATLNTCAGASCWQFQLYTYTEGLAGFTDGWQLMRAFVTAPKSYQLNRINRLKFWIKVPEGIAFKTDGSETFQFGTYVRCSTCTGAEEGGGHWYHHYNLGYTGRWHQIIVDTHPNHLRGADGALEHGDQLHPTNETGFTYFDTMTRFYLDSGYIAVPPGATFLLDSFEVYEETRLENVEQIYSLNAVYVPETKTVRVGWMRNKSEDTKAHEVRYDFSDIFDLGFDAATLAPGGTIMPPGTGGYNAMSYVTTQIDTTGHDTLYVAIRPEGATRFRQIAIPIQ